MPSCFNIVLSAIKVSDISSPEGVPGDVVRGVFSAKALAKVSVEAASDISSSEVVPGEVIGRVSFNSPGCKS